MKKIKKDVAVRFIIGSFMILFTLLTFFPFKKHMSDLSFISNILGGFLFISDGFLRLKKHKYNLSFLYHIETITIDVVFIVSVLCRLFNIYNFRFNNGMFFLRFIDPIIVTIYYLLIESKKAKFKSELLYAPLIVICYLIFDYIYFLYSGKFIYGLIDTRFMNIIAAIILLILIYLLLYLYCLAIDVFGKKLSKKYNIKL